MPLLRVSEDEERGVPGDDEGEEEERENDCATNQVQPFWVGLNLAYVLYLFHRNKQYHYYHAHLLIYVVHRRKKIRGKLAEEIRKQIFQITLMLSVAMPTR